MGTLPKTQTAGTRVLQEATMCLEHKCSASVIALRVFQDHLPALQATSIVVEGQFAAGAVDQTQRPLQCRHMLWTLLPCQPWSWTWEILQSLCMKWVFTSQQCHAQQFRSSGPVQLVAHALARKWHLSHCQPSNPRLLDVDRHTPYQPAEHRTHWHGLWEFPGETWTASVQYFDKNHGVVLHVLCRM